MTLKRISAFALSLLICAAIAGCSDTNSGTSANEDITSASASDTVSETEASTENAGTESSTENEENVQRNTDSLVIAKQGMFSSGGTVTDPVGGDYDPTQNWLDVTRAGNTAHIDHANVFY